MPLVRAVNARCAECALCVDMGWLPDVLCVLCVDMGIVCSGAGGGVRGTSLQKPHRANIESCASAPGDHAPPPGGCVQMSW